jgi:hypothetical protein
MNMPTRKSSKIIRTLIVCIIASSLCLINEPSKVRATWLWNTSLISTDTEQILSFAKQNRINLIFLQINQKQDFSEYRAFIKKATLSGIAIHALDGDPSWAKGENKHKIEELVDWVNSYNEKASLLQKIKGIHLDVEPYNQTAWETGQRQSIIDGWLAAANYFTELAGSLKGVELGVDLPFWLDEIPVNPSKDAMSMSRWMLEKLDYITIMAYRDQALSRGGIVDAVRDEIETASRLHKRVLVGIETNSTGQSYTSFYGKELSDVIHQVQLIDQSLSVFPSYQGIAVHDYVGWKQLVQKKGQPEKTG